MISYLKEPLIKVCKPLHLPPAEVLRVEMIIRDCERLAMFGLGANRVTMESTMMDESHGETMRPINGSHEDEHVIKLKRRHDYLAGFYILFITDTKVGGKFQHLKYPRMVDVLL